MNFGEGKFRVDGWATFVFDISLRVQRHFPIFRRYSYPFLRPFPLPARSARNTRDSAVPHKWTIKFYQSCCQFQNVDWYSSCCVCTHTQAKVGESATNASSLGCIICLDVSSHTLRRYILRIQHESRSSFNFLLPSRVSFLLDGKTLRDRASYS